VAKWITSGNKGLIANFMDTSTESDLPLAELAYRQLRRAIVQCEFAPGQRLRIDELSKRYEISSSPLREALSRLSEQGMVRSMENRGFHVTPLTVEGVADLTRVRLLVESEALRDAMLHGSDRWEADVVAAAHSLSLIEQRLSDGPQVLDETWSQRHRAFHMAIYSGCTSPVLKDIVAGLFERTERYRQFAARNRKVEKRKNSEHQRLLAAVLARGEEKAVGLLRQHISSTERNVTECLQGMPGGTLQ
jgi:GntR family transcriptional regulator, carbon starvation induced regulator